MYSSILIIPFVIMTHTYAIQVHQVDTLVTWGHLITHPGQYSFSFEREAPLKVCGQKLFN